MKHILTAIVLLSLAFITACDDDHNGNPVEYDYYPPLPPVGIRTTSLDNAVQIDWIDNQEDDIAGYNVFVAPTYDGRYELIGHTSNNRFVDNGARNGVTYYYAVTAYDFSGNESALSKDVAYDTPRPEGLGLMLYDRFVDPNRAGYDFSANRQINYDTDNTDCFVEFSNGKPYLVVWEDSDVQDMGYTKNLDEISVAPDAGWSPSKDAHIIVGHTYVIWTFDNHFAKVRITEIAQNYVRFDWAYQTATGNPELFRPDDKNLSKNTVRSRHTARVH